MKNNHILPGAKAVVAAIKENAWEESNTPRRYEICEFNTIFSNEYLRGHAN